MSFFVVAICRTCLSMGHLLKAPLLLLFKGTFDFSYKTRPPVVSVQFIFRRVVVIIFQTDERLGQTRFCLAHRRPLFYCVLGSDDSWSRAAVYLPQKCHDLLFYFIFYFRTPPFLLEQRSTFGGSRNLQVAKKLYKKQKKCWLFRSLPSRLKTVARYGILFVLSARLKDVR